MKWKVNDVATGLLIKQKCIETGHTPKELSELFGVSITVPYLWFTGRSMPKLDNLVCLSKLFNCAIEELLVIEEDSTEQGVNADAD